MEVERISRSTKIAEEHPDWFQTRFLQGIESQVVDMTNPEAAAWVKSQIEKLIKEYGIDLFRLDFNVAYEMSICKNDRGGVAECNYLRSLRYVCFLAEEISPYRVRKLRQRRRTC